MWVENYLTATGRLLHHKTEHYFRESRKNVILEYGVEIASKKHRLFGQADAVEYHYLSEQKKELVSVAPIEYKRGKAKADKSDDIQLCAQALCLEEMLALHINTGFLFYYSKREKCSIALDYDLRSKTEECIRAVHSLFSDIEIPRVEFAKGCKSCSMREVCFPNSAGRGKAVNRYIGQRIISKEAE
jgi:CRISPR-associated exonuclease Cas4